MAGKGSRHDVRGVDGRSCLKQPCVITWLLVKAIVFIDSVCSHGDRPCRVIHICMLDMHWRNSLPSMRYQVHGCREVVVMSVADVITFCAETTATPKKDEDFLCS